MDYIIVKNIRAFSYHGVSAQEKIVGNDYSVNLKLGLSLKKAGITDNLKDTVNYADIVDLVRKEMSKKSNLIENVAERICASIKETFSSINSVEIEVSKINPPVSGQVDSTSVFLVR